VFDNSVDESSNQNVKTNRHLSGQQQVSRRQVIEKSRAERRVTTSQSTSLNLGKSSALSRFSQASKVEFRNRIAARDKVFVPTLRTPLPPPQVVVPSEVRVAAADAATSPKGSNQTSQTSHVPSNYAGRATKSENAKPPLDAAFRVSTADSYAVNDPSTRKRAMGRSNSSLSENQDDDANLPASDETVQNPSFVTMYILGPSTNTILVPDTARSCFSFGVGCPFCFVRAVSLGNTRRRNQKKKRPKIMIRRWPKKRVKVMVVKMPLV
jgi:hypothetical protein